MPVEARFTQQFLTFEAVLPLTSSSDASYTLSLPTFEDATIVEFKVVRTIHVTSLEGTSPTLYTGPLGANGLHQSDSNGCNARVTFSYYHPSTGSTPWYDMECAGQSGDPPAKDSVHGITKVRGTGQVTRTSLFTSSSSYCGGNPCRTYSGDQTVSVRVLPAELALLASKRMVTLGEYVTFTPQTEPAYIGGFAVPIRVTGWQWIPAGDTGQTSACPAWFQNV